MDDKLVTKEELIEKGYDYEDLEMEPPSDQLFVRTGEDGDDLVPVNGLVYELSEQDGSVLNYGEYADGLPHGISVDFHPNGQVKQTHSHFHGPVHGEQRKWDKEGRLVFQGEYVYGVLVRYQQWNASGNLIGEQLEPDPVMHGLIESQRAHYEKRG